MSLDVAVLEGTAISQRVCTRLYKHQDVQPELCTVSPAMLCNAVTSKWSGPHTSCQSL